MMQSKQHPILFSTAMVQAILAGRKTQTRRIMKPQPEFRVGQIIKEGDEQYFHPKEPDGWKPLKCWALAEARGTNGGCFVHYYKCPYGQVGDVLWVRETWATHPPYNDERPSIICGDDQPFTIHKNSGFKTPVIHKAGKENNAWGMCGEPKWKPSIHMPRSACRLYLQITDIRVERLNEISEEDAKAEGVKTHHTKLGITYYDYTTGYFNGLLDAKESFQTLWQSINGHDSWQANPFVWVISFKKIDKPS